MKTYFYLTFVIFYCLVLSGCSTVATPVLRHETAETLGAAKFRVRASLAQSHVFAALPSSLVTSTTGVTQEGALFRAWVPSVQATGGVIEKLDLSLGTTILLKGGGWRLGSKYQILKGGALSVAALAGIGRYSSQGDLDFLTTTGVQSETATLSASQLDFGGLASFRFSPEWAAYGGVQFYKTSLSGSVDTDTIDESELGYGPNLGIQYSRGSFEATLEAMFLKVHDPVTDSGKFNLYFGVSGGLKFP